MIQVRKIDGDEYRCICPLHKDDKESLSINVKKNAAICFAGCFEGRAVDLISKIEKLPKIIAWRKMVSGAVFDFDLEEIRKDRASYVPVPNNGLQWLPGDHTNYLMDRGFDRSTIRYWDIKYCPEINHIRIPVHNNAGELICFSYRTLDKNVEPRYLHPNFKKKEGLLFSEAFFEASKDNTVYVVEGPLDCIWLWQCGFHNTLAFLGTPSKRQVERLCEYGEKFVLCLDNDDAGQEVTRKLLRYFTKINKEVCSIKLPESVKDVQELDKNKLLKIITRRH